MRFMRFKHILSRMMSIALLLAFFFIPSGGYGYVSNSKLASGRWLKIEVTQRGINRISFETLKRFGFDNPERVKVYGYGGALAGIEKFDGSVPDDLPMQRSIIYNNSILFYGEPGLKADMLSVTTPQIYQNYDSDSGYYFLSDAPTDESVTATVPFNRSASNTVNRHLTQQFIHPDSDNVAKGGVTFYGENLVNLPFKGYNINLPGFIPGSELNISGRVAFGSAPTAIIVKGATTQRQLTKYDETTDFTSQTFSLKVPQYAEDSIAVTFSENGDPTLDYIAVEYLNASYERENRLDTLPQIIMTFRNVDPSSRCCISAPSGTLLWRINNDASITPIEVSMEPDGISFTPDTQFSVSNFLKVIAFDPAAALPEVIPVEIIDNSNLHAMETPHLLIIATDETIEQAERLADLHRKHQSMDVAVIEQHRIFNEFSSGTPSSMAYRRLARMLHDRNPEKFRYLLLFGAGSFDNRRKLQATRSYGPSRLLMTYPVRDRACQGYDAGRYSSDAVFGMIGDNFNPDKLNNTAIIPDIAIGRIPASDKTDAAGYVDKVELFFNSFANYASASGNAIGMADDGDSDEHISQAEQIASLIRDYRKDITVKKIYDAFYPWKNNIAIEANRAVKDALSAGAGYMYYVGHGLPGSFTGEYMWTTRHVIETEYPTSPLIMLATCEPFPFDRLIDNIGEKMLYKPSGGGLIVIGNGRYSYGNHNHTLQKAVVNEFFTARPGTTYGDVWLSALKQVLSSKSSILRINTLGYNFGGDPALPIPVPTHRIQVETPENLTVSGNDIIAGSIINSSTEMTDTDFNGKVTITVWESPDSIPNLYQTSSTKKIPENEKIVRQIEIDETPLYTAMAQVKNGQFNTTVNLPIPRTPGKSHRVTVSAVNDGGNAVASGVTICRIVNNEDAAVSDNYPPVIHSIEIADINDSKEFIATMNDAESGIALTTGALRGTAPRILLDNKHVYRASAHELSGDSHDIVEFRHDMGRLSDGPHSIKLYVTDNCGNISTDSISFTVINLPDSAFLIPTCDQGDNRIRLEIQHSFDFTPEASLVIETLDRHHIFSCRNVSFPFIWNATDNDDRPVPDGIYKARVYLKSGNRHCVSAPVNITILGNKEEFNLK